MESQPSPEQDARKLEADLSFSTACCAVPFARAVSTVFTGWLGCEIEWRDLTAKTRRAPRYDVSSAIGLSGKATGTVILTLSAPLALKMLQAMLGVEVQEVNTDVFDAVGELTNMVAGAAKTSLEELQLVLGVPQVFTGDDPVSGFSPEMELLCVTFDTAWGPMALELGLELTPQFSRRRDGRSSSLIGQGIP